MLQLRGADVSKSINESIRELMPKFYELNILPTFAIVRVGNNKSQIAYEEAAEKKAKSLGIQCEKFICDDNIKEDELISVIEHINNDDKIHGILLMQPLPESIDGDVIRNKISVEKDIDCISDNALGEFFVNWGKEGVIAPCTAEAALEILKFYKVNMSGETAVVIGRSMVVGKPLANMLLSENCTVTICHSRTEYNYMSQLCRSGKIIVSAVGKIDSLGREAFSGNQVVVDVGINFDENGKMTGDLNFEDISPLTSAMTPVPGGVGAVTTSILMRNVITCAKKHIKKGTL